MAGTLHLTAVQGHGLQPAGQFLVRLHNQRSQVLRKAAIVLVEEGGGQPKVAHPPSSTDPTNILLHVAGHVEVDHVLGVGDVKSSGSHCCGNDDRGLTALKAPEK